MSTAHVIGTNAPGRTNGHAANRRIGGESEERKCLARGAGQDKAGGDSAGVGSGKGGRVSWMQTKRSRGEVAQERCGSQ